MKAACFTKRNNHVTLNLLYDLIIAAPLTTYMSLFLTSVSSKATPIPNILCLQLAYHGHVEEAAKMDRQTSAL
jgi:hypothetical protein